MNEKIKQLVEQAPYTTISTEGRLFSQQDLAKFAELIVKECILELGISKKCDPYTGELFVCEHNTVLDEQIEMLKQHFGVEE